VRQQKKVGTKMPFLPGFEMKGKLNPVWVGAGQRGGDNRKKKHHGCGSTKKKREVNKGADDLHA